MAFSFKHLAWVTGILLGCSADPTSSAGGYRLTVEHGFGSGTFAAGDVVEVFAGHDPTAEVFLGWTGDASELANPAEWHTQVTMPEHDVVVTATAAARTVSLMEDEWMGVTTAPKSIHYILPDGAPTGLLLMLHGTWGTSKILVRTEELAIALAARERGLVVLAPTSEETATDEDADGDGKLHWDLEVAPDNIDIQNLEVLLEQLYGTMIPDGTPLYVAGMSNGGAMSFALNYATSNDTDGLIPRLDGARAFVSYCASGRVSFIGGVDRPHAWYLAAEDTNEEVGPEAIDRAQMARTELEDRGIRARLSVHPATALYPERFARIDGIDQERSRRIHDELVAAEYLDETGWNTVPPHDIRDAVEADPSRLPSLEGLELTAAAGVFQQIDASFADHQMYSDDTESMLDFLMEEG